MDENNDDKSVFVEFLDLRIDVFLEVEVIILINRALFRAIKNFSKLTKLHA